MAAAKKKKTTKRVVHSKSAPRAVSSVRAGHRHSSILSDNALMMLALFFALVGLLMVMVMKRQNDDFDAYVRTQQMDVQKQYVPMIKPSATPMMKKTK